MDGDITAPIAMGLERLFSDGGLALILAVLFIIVLLLYIWSENKYRRQQDEKRIQVDIDNIKVLQELTLYVKGSLEK